MKLYDYKMAPNPRRVHIFLAEKGLSYDDIGLDVITIDIGKGETFKKEFREISPYGGVPVLELDDGTRISESVAICRYFEEMYPENPLMGTDPKSKANIEMWNRRVELNLFNSIALCFRHSNPMWKNVLTQVPELSPVSAENAKKQLHKLNKQLEHNEFIAGDEFSVADITAFCAVDFAKMIRVRIDTERDPHLERWYQGMSARSSVSA